MELLLFKSRTEKELKSKLIEKGYPDDEIEEATSYVKSFGYLNDESYAAQYVDVNKAKKGKAALRFELKKKGIAEDLIEKCLEEIEEDEADTVMALIIKRAGEPHDLDDGEYRRLSAFLARRGFGTESIRKALRQYASQ